MRRPERIPIILDIFFDDPLILAQFTGLDLYEAMPIYEKWGEIKNFWTENPDLRFGQLLVNIGILPHNSKVWFTEEQEWLVENKWVGVEEVMFWGKNYDKEGKLLDKTVFILLKDMTTDHIEGIIDFYGGREEASKKINPLYYKYFLSRIFN